MSPSPEPRRVLVATDLTNDAARAYPLARALADALSARLELVHVVHDPAMLAANPQVTPPSAVANPQQREEVDHSLERWAERLGPTAQTHVVVGGASSAESLAAYAEEQGALLVAVASHGRSGIERLLAGSFTEVLLRTASVPLLVIPVAATDEETDEEAEFVPRATDGAEDGPLAHGRILVAIDETADSHAVLAPAAQLARAIGARVTLLHVTGELLAVPLGELAIPPASPVEYTRHLDRAHERLEAARARLGDLPVDTELLVGDPIPAITRFANEQPFDFVCMASHGRRGLKRLLVGSTTEGVLRHVTRPVVVFPIH